MGNILVQTMEGRRQKAREGRWNGGFAPYGYQLVNGELIIAEDEAEIIRIIYDKFANTTMGMAAIAAFLNNSGYKKKLRQNNTIEGFSTSFVKECESYEEFIRYIEFRKKNQEVISTLDELDAFGFFKKNENVKISIDADELMLTDFTSEFDKKYMLEDKKVF